MESKRFRFGECRLFRLPLKDFQVEPSKTWSWDLIATLFSDSRDALILVDRDEQVVAANEGWYLLCGADQGQLLGRNFSNIVTLAHPSEMASVVQRAVTRMEAVTESVVCRHGHGFDLKLEALVMPIRDTAGDVVGILGRLRPPQPAAARADAA